MIALRLTVFVSYYCLQLQLVRLKQARRQHHKEILDQRVHRRLVFKDFLAFRQPSPAQPDQAQVQHPPGLGKGLQMQVVTLQLAALLTPRRVA